MKMMNECQFNADSLSFLQKLVGQKLNRIDKEKNFFVLGFSGNNNYLFHIFSFLRVKKRNVVILTIGDDLLFPDHTPIGKRFRYGKKVNLLKKTLLKMKDALDSFVVSQVNISKTADITIVFENGVSIEILNYFVGQNTIFYEIFKDYDVSAPFKTIMYLDEKIVIKA